MMFVIPEYLSRAVNCNALSIFLYKVKLLAPILSKTIDGKPVYTLSQSLMRVLVTISQPQATKHSWGLQLARIII